MIIIGIDEVGRGPLAGPLVLCGCAFGDDFDNNLKIRLNDSKKLSEKNRNQICEELKKSDIYFTIQESSSNEVDKYGLAYCMKKNIKNIEDYFLSLNLNDKLYFILDGKVNYLNQKGESVIKADEKICECMAASIIAKSYRDLMMKELGKIYPHYEFNANVGYGTRRHYEAIEKYGICNIHRKSFLKKIINH